MCPRKNNQIYIILIYIMLPQSKQQFQVLNKQSPKKIKCNCGKLYTLSQLHQIDEDFYCEQCLKNQIAIERKEIQNLQQKYIFYKEYQASISSSQLAYLQKQQLTKQQQQQLYKQQKQLLATLSQLKLYEQKNNETINKLKEKVLELDKEQIKYWQSINKFQKRLYRLEQKSITARWQLKIANQQYQRLQKFNVLTQIFKITCEGQVGYINGLAIGKKSRQKNEIDWQEVNAGLGHLFLLFCFLIIKYQYSCIRMVQRQCCGSNSRVKIANKVYEIGYTKQKEKQFGEFLDEFLIEFQHLRIHIQKNSEQKIEFPNKVVIGQYKINNQFINPTKIKTGKWDYWTISMKYFLTNFEYISTLYSLSDKYL